MEGGRSGDLVRVFLEGAGSQQGKQHSVRISRNQKVWECSEKGGRWTVGPEECVFCILMVMNYTDMGEQRRDGELDRELELDMLGQVLGAVSNGCDRGMVWG